MPMTDLGIANIAFVDLGQPTIAVADSQSKAGRLFLSTYEPTVLEVLRDHPWRCCRKLALLAADPTAPPFGYAHAFRKPDDFVRIIYVNGSNDGTLDANIEPFAVHGDFIHCDIDVPQLTYTARVPTAQFDPGLVSTIAARLAWRWCKPFSDSISDVQTYMKVYTDIAAAAKYADALDGSPDLPPMSSWEQARLSDV